MSTISLLITTALAEKMSALMTVDYLEGRAARGDRGKSEVDTVVEDQLRLYPIEVKASATPRPEMVRGIAELARTLSATKAEGLRPSLQPGYVVYAGDRVAPLGGGVTAWRRLHAAAISEGERPRAARAPSLRSVYYASTGD